MYQRNPKSDRRILLALVPPTLMVNASIFMGFALMFAIPGNPTPVQSEGFGKILFTILLYPLLSAPLTFGLAWKIKRGEKVARDSIKVSLITLYTVFIGAWVRIIHGFILFTSSQS